MVVVVPVALSSPRRRRRRHRHSDVSAQVAELVMQVVPVPRWMLLQKMQLHGVPLVAAVVLDLARPQRIVVLRPEVQTESLRCGASTNTRRLSPQARYMA